MDKIEKAFRVNIINIVPQDILSKNILRNISTQSYERNKKVYTTTTSRY